MTMTWRFLGIIAFALVLVVVVAFLLVGGNPITFFQRVLLVPDGTELVKNGSFEDSKPLTTENVDEHFVPGPNVVVLCDHSTYINDWMASGLGPLNLQKCLNGNTFDVLGYVANPDHCEPNVPPCPNSSGIAARQGNGNRFVNLTGVSGRPPRNYGSVSQDVQTVIGQTYELSFFIGSSSNNLIVGDKSGAVSVEIAGVVIPGNPFPAPPPQDASNWSDQISRRFDAVNGTTTLTFHGTTVVPGEKGTGYIGLDNVSFQKVCSIVIAILFGCP